MIVIRRKGGCASDQGQKPEEKDGGNHACVKMCPVQSEVSKSGSCPACMYRYRYWRMRCFAVELPRVSPLSRSLYVENSTSCAAACKKDDDVSRIYLSTQHFH